MGPTKRREPMKNRRDQVDRTMLSLCSATPSCSRSQMSFCGGSRPFSLCRKDFDVKCLLEDRVGFLNGTRFHGVSFKTQGTVSFYSNLVKITRPSASIDTVSSQLCSNGSENIECKLSTLWSTADGTIDELNSMVGGELKYEGGSGQSMVEEGLADQTDQLTQNANSLLVTLQPETTSTIDFTQDNPASPSSALDMDNISGVKTSAEDLLVRFKESVGSSVNKGEDSLNSSLDKITSSITSITKSATEAVDNALNGVFSTVEQTSVSSGDKLENFSSDLKEATIKAGVIAIDLLRRTIVTVEDSLANGASSVVYSYGSAKELLPPDVRSVLNLSEDTAVQVLRPVGTTLQQAYSTIEGLERSLGLDPYDPILPFVILVGTSATLWVSYWVWTYGGYSGDLSPEETMEILKGKENAALIDVRPEDLRKKDGIPDLRRAARFRYASVVVPEVDGSVKKLLKSGRDLDDILAAAVIRNLKIVKDRSKVIVMDVDGTRSKGIARSLRKLGLKRPYILQGGFRSWVKEGMRAKELKPETTFTILNEEAEAILEDISPSPLQILGFGVGSVAALFAILEWEKTLQFIGVLGLSQTIYRRVASYENTKDLNEDMRLLLAPVQLGAQALSKVAGKLETNRVGLPTSPSSSDVQNRVLQAAAKHESQPSDAEGLQNPSTEPMASANENVDLNEA